MHAEGYVAAVLCTHCRPMVQGNIEDITVARYEFYV